VPDDVIARLKPWAALTNLTVTPEDYEKVTLDQKLWSSRASGRFACSGWKASRTDLVFDRLPLDTQVELLRHALDHRDELAAMIEPTSGPG